MNIDNKETFTLKYNLKTHSDDDAESPREWDNLGTIVCSHSKYSLGDEQENSSQGVFENIANALDMEDFDSDIYDEAGYKRAVEAISEVAYIEPVSLHDHSGISMSLGRSSGWDCGQVGFIYVSKETIKNNFPALTTEEDLSAKASEVFQAEVNTYTTYLENECYGYEFTITTELEDGIEIELVEDSCWGFYGSEIQENGMQDHINPYLPEGRKVKEFYGYDNNMHIGSEEEYSETQNIAFGDLSDSFKDKILKAKENIGLKIVDEKVKINGTFIDNSIFADKKTDWIVKNRVEFLNSLNEKLQTAEANKDFELVDSLNVDIVFLEGFKDDFFYVGESNDFVLKSDNLDTFESISDSLLALNRVKQTLDRNAEKRLKNSESKHQNLAHQNSPV